MAPCLLGIRAIKAFNTFKIGLVRKEVRHEMKQIMFDKVPIGFVECWTESVRAWARLDVHRIERRVDFILGERGDKGLSLIKGENRISKQGGNIKREVVRRTGTH